MGASGYKKNAFVDAGGKFSIYVDEPGVYRLDAFHQLFFFEPVIVEVLSEDKMAANPSKKQYSAYIYKMNTASKGVRLLYPLHLDPSHKVRYFDVEEPFNPIDYMKNPYFMMIGFSMVMMFMMKQVPKEEMAEYQDQQSE